MKIIDPSFEIVNLPDRDSGIQKLRNVERIARVSHRSEEAQKQDTWKGFLSFVLMTKGDWSIAEHESVTVKARVDRGVSHEWVRHRIGAYTQESTRFCNYGKTELEFIEPVWPSGIIGNVEWKLAMNDAERSYLYLLESGCSSQIARSVLPNALATTLIVTYNLRSWRQFFMMRTTKETHPDFRRTAIPMLKAFQERIPLLYDDIVPEERQSISLSKPR